MAFASCFVTFIPLAVFGQPVDRLADRVLQFCKYLLFTIYCQPSFRSGQGQSSPGWLEPGPGVQSAGGGSRATRGSCQVRINCFREYTIVNSE